MLVEPRGGREFRPWTEAADRHGLAGVGDMDHDRRHAGEMHVFALQHAERDTAGNTRVDRIAARFKDFKSCLCGKEVGGCHHMPRADDPRMMCGHMMLVGHLYSPFRGAISATWMRSSIRGVWRMRLSIAS